MDEFAALINSRMPTPTDDEGRKKREAKLRKWYEALDANGDGVIDPTEYFMFALKESLFRAEHENADLFAKHRDGAEKDASAFGVCVLTHCC